MKTPTSQLYFTFCRGALLLFFCLGLPALIWAQSQPTVPTADQQIKAAVSALPTSMQAGAKVYGYTPEGKWTTLRKGTNELICIADKPGDDRFHVACYFSDLEPFMKRGRELRAEGKSNKETDRIRKQEIEAGTLAMPDKPMALYNLTGGEDGYDYQTGTVVNARPLFVVYIPFATEASTGITTSPSAPNSPWLMEPGLPWAHIMISGQAVGTKAEGN